MSLSKISDSDQSNSQVHPGVLIAATHSGSGKTLITCALLQAMKNRHLDVCSFKCGPDYIDPMFHRQVLGIDSENLDTWLSGETACREQYLTIGRQHQISVIEGVMGLYDGAGGTEITGSSYHLSMVTGAPIVLVVDVHGMSRSMLPLIKGFLDYDKNHCIHGIILNRISPSFYETMKPLVTELLHQYPDTHLLGYFPVRKDLQFSSRHLGLYLPHEIPEILHQLQAAAEQLTQTVDLDSLLKIAGHAQVFERESLQHISVTRPFGEIPLTLAVARDEAFCFYYPANLRMFEQAGVKITYFSPLHDKELPSAIHGILLGGGYPENYAAELSKNQSMQESIRQAISNGVPSLAECGGFLYLHKSIKGSDGEIYPMTGLVNAHAENKRKLVRFGYVTLTEKHGYFIASGTSIRAHEFHYYDSTQNGDSCIAAKTNGRSWECIHSAPGHFWGYPHLYYPSSPEFVSSFITYMKAFHDKQTI